MKAKISLGEIHKKYGLSQRVCQIIGLDVWAMHENLLGSKDVVEINSEQARAIGLSDEEFVMRLN